ncbi:site-specific integrase [Mesorhizobium sp. M0016]|uniref:site-specific integrase n=1 Tax=Mesorhizobium sp. M0016 TaxID=2956843 RepID=UPI003335B61C
MATYTKLSSGSWRVQVRRKGRYVSETFLRRDDARRWATEAERQVDRGETPTKSRIARLKTFGELIDLHIDDMCDVGKSPRRSKAAALDMLQRHLGKCNIAALDRERLIRFGRDRAAQGAGPMTLGMDIGFVKLILAHAAAVHGLPVKVEPVDLARIALKRLGLVGKGNQRDRRPTQDELDRLIAHFDANPRQIAPVGQIIRFAVATAMRQEEICKARWWAIVEDRLAKRSNDDDRIFPFNHRSVGTAFRRGCADLAIDDLHFHDLRHEGTSRLFEAGFTIEQVALVTGHKDWKMLRRYTHLKPEMLHTLQAARAA